VGGQRKRNGPKGRHRASGLPNQVKVRDHGRVVSKALVVAYAVHESGIREVIGLDVGEVKSGSFWVEFLRGLKRRGLAGVRLAITDQHEGLKHAVARVLGCPWQRCSVHFTRDMVMHCRRDQRGLVAAALREIFQARTGPPRRSGSPACSSGSRRSRRRCASCSSKRRTT